MNIAPPPLTGDFALDRWLSLFWKKQAITLAVPVASTSGTAIDFTGIPATVKRITVMFNGVSTSGSSLTQIQLGDSGGVETSGYSGSTGTSNHSSGFLLWQGALVAGTVEHASAVLTNITGNTWVFSFSGGLSSSAAVISGAGTKSLTATLDRIRITTVGGTNTFDLGQINIMYES